MAQVRVRSAYPPIRMSVTEARGRMAEVVEKCRERDVVLTWWGEEVAVMVHPKRLKRNRRK